MCWSIIIIFFNYTALNAVERSVHLHGPSRLPAVNSLLIITIAMHRMTAVKESDFFFCL